MTAPVPDMDRIAGGVVNSQGKDGSEGEERRA